MPDTDDLILTEADILDDAAFDVDAWQAPEMDDAEALRVFRETAFLHRSVKDND